MTPARRHSQPGQPRMTARTFRVPDPVYEAAMASAKARGDHLSEIVRQALELYVRETSVS